MTKLKPKFILVTGSNGFIGKNLIKRLDELNSFQILSFVRGGSIESLEKLVFQADFIIHLAGENRPENVDNFNSVNVELTKNLCKAIKLTGRNIPLIFTSSIQASQDTDYGKSKYAAEVSVEGFAKETKNTIFIYRLPGVFGKWCRPNYNSVIATFCHNISRDLPIIINDSKAVLKVTYIDDLLDHFINRIDGSDCDPIWQEIEKVYEITIGELAKQIKAFKTCRTDLTFERVGTGLVRALYATYISYLPPEKFAYEIPSHGDTRGIFAELFKSPDAGQVSFFSIIPGVTRGSHYHHTKTEKFCLISGKALIRFRHLSSNEKYEVVLGTDRLQVVDTIPGWVHDITNIGSKEALVVVWANEVFDKSKPDTIPAKV